MSETRWRNRGRRPCRFKEQINYLLVTADPPEMKLFRSNCRSMLVDEGIVRGYVSEIFLLLIYRFESDGRERSRTVGDR